MGVDPADAAAVEPVVANKINCLFVRDRIGVGQLFVTGQKEFATPDIADEEFAEDERMADYLAIEKKPLEFRSEGGSISEEAQPDGGIDENFHAAFRFSGLRLGAGSSRRRGTSTTSVSLPR